jgi:hypothetical protein
MIKHRSGLGGRTIGRSGHALCDLYYTHGGDEKHVLFSLSSKPVTTVYH